MNAIKLICVSVMFAFAIGAKAQKFIIVRPKTLAPAAKETKPSVNKRPNTAKRSHQGSKSAKNSNARQETYNQEESTPTESLLAEI